MNTIFVFDKTNIMKFMQKGIKIAYIQWENYFIWLITCGRLMYLHVFMRQIKEKNRMKKGIIFMFDLCIFFAS